MVRFTGFRSWLLLFTAVVLACGAITATAGATGFGELTRFGERGVGSGQFTESGTAAQAFGVDTTDNTVYVGDEPEAHLFRIQKFSESGTLLGSATLKTKGGAEAESGIEGVAIDPAEKRFYVLVVQSRAPGHELDPEVPVAGALYAFSTSPNSAKELEPASGTVLGSGGVLAGTTVFHPQSETPSQMLLEPSGIAVDPKNDDIIVMGREDRESLGQEPALRVALEQINPNGTPGARWVDKSEPAFFETGGSEIATSPVVNSEGKVFVIGGELFEDKLKEERPRETIVEIPQAFGAGEVAKTFANFDPGPGNPALVSFPGNPAPLAGAGLSIGGEGTLWAFANVFNMAEGEEVGNRLPGALGFNPDGSELGWTGGQSAALGLEKCTISFLGHPMVAAGSEQKVFMFDSNPAAPHVVEFGPGGGGCPTGKASALAVSVVGHPVETGGVVAPGAEATLSIALSEANAKEVKWSFGDGTEATTSGQHQTPETIHKFVGEGEFIVKATIKTDNLDTPELVAERTVTVSKPLPTAKLTAPTSAKVGEVITFDAGKSEKEEGAAITEYKWEFGDGATSTTTTPTTTHSYGAAGSYSVTLRVLDANKRTSKPFTVSVAVAAPPPPPPPPPPPVGTTTTTTTPPPPPPTSGVLAYRAVFAGTAFTVSKTGSVAITVDCAAQSACAGTVTLRTLTAVSAAKHKKAILTLASGSFSLAGGHAKALSLHLTAKGRALLAKAHTLRVRATILARDSSGAMHATVAVLTLRAAKKHH